MNQAAKRRTRYLGFVAHEIKNPLSTALWSSDLLHRMGPEDRGGPRGDRMLDASVRALRKMRRLVDDFFSLERLEEGGLEIRLESISLRELFEPVLQTLSEKDGVPTAGWQVDLPDLPVQADAELVRRSLRALLEYLYRVGGQAPVSVMGEGAGGRARLFLKGQAPAGQSLIPPSPEERDRQQPDPTGNVLGFALAQAVFSAHGGAVEESGEGLRISLALADPNAGSSP